MNITILILPWVHIIFLGLYGWDLCLKLTVLLEWLKVLIKNDLRHLEQEMYKCIFLIKIKLQLCNMAEKSDVRLTVKIRHAIYLNESMTDRLL